MKKLIVVAALAAVVCGTALAAETAKGTNVVKRTGAQRRAARERRIAAEGGLLARPYAGKPVYIVNDQKRVDPKDFFRPGQTIEGLFEFPIEVVAPKTDVSKAALVITISDNTMAPALLVAPEVPWAGVNVGALAADDPKPEKLVKRLQKEIWRAFMYACGAANSVMQPCVMRPIFSLRDLDAYPVAMPCPDSLPRVMSTAKALGVGETSACTYKQACVEGWAPAPTNDVQRAISEQVKAEKERGPSNPIEIKPPKATK